MFCKINVLGTTGLERVTNMMKGVRAVATAAAGSTPSTSGTDGGTPYEIITAVLANTAAGGWTLSSMNHDAATASGGTPTNSAVMCVKQATGKPTTPYAHFMIWPDSDESHWYPVCMFADETPTVNSGATSTATWKSHDATKGATWPNRSGNSNGANSINDTTAGGVYYVYAVDGCIHIHGGTSRNEGFFHWGTRTNMSWEDNYADNPYYVALLVSPGGNYYGYWTDMYIHNKTTQTTTGPVAMKGWWNGDYNTGNNTHPIFGTTTQSNNTTPEHQLNQSQLRSGNASVEFPNVNFTGSAGSQLNGTGASTSTNYYPISATATSRLRLPIMRDKYDIGVTSDSSTGALIPAAIPIPIGSTYAYNQGGILEHILHGAGFDNETDLAAYFTDEATYTIDNVDYIGLRWNSYWILYIRKQ